MSKKIRIFDPRLDGKAEPNLKSLISPIKLNCLVDVIPFLLMIEKCGTVWPDLRKDVDPSKIFGWSTFNANVMPAQSNSFRMCFGPKIFFSYSSKPIVLPQCNTTIALDIWLWHM